MQAGRIDPGASRQPSQTAPARDRRSQRAHRSAASSSRRAPSRRGSRRNPRSVRRVAPCRRAVPAPAGTWLFKRVDHEARDTAQVRWVDDRVGHGELGRPSVVARQRDPARAALVVLSPNAITRPLAARYCGDSCILRAQHGIPESSADRPVNHGTDRCSRWRCVSARPTRAPGQPRPDFGVPVRPNRPSRQWPRDRGASRGLGPAHPARMTRMLTPAMRIQPTA